MSHYKFLIIGEANFYMVAKSRYKFKKNIYYTYYNRVGCQPVPVHIIGFFLLVVEWHLSITYFDKK